MMDKCPKRVEIEPSQLTALTAKLTGCLTAEECALVERIFHLCFWLQTVIKEQSITLAKLKRMFFGNNRTESFKNLKNRGGDATKNSPGDSTETATAKDASIDTQNVPTLSGDNSSHQNAEPEGQKPPKKKGHGKRPLEMYNLSKIHFLLHGSLINGDVCPLCEQGKVYNYDPEVLLVLKGQVPLRAEAYCAQGLRCNRCQAIFRAKFPKEIIEQSRADIVARAFVCLAKYRLGTPLHRLQAMQQVLNIPISDAEMWEWTESVALVLWPVHQALAEIAARGSIIHNDDTTAKVLDLMLENACVEKEEKASPDSRKDKFRKGMYTSILLSKIDNLKIAFYCTGRKNAGENLDDLMDKRPKDLSPPVQACDASSSNAPERHVTKVSHCFNHARHNFCELVEVWPAHALAVVQLINGLFMNDRATQSMSPEERCSYHKKHSSPIVDELYTYCNDLVTKKIVEPNSSFGKSVAYLNNHKEGLTLFLRDGEAPLSNNDAERGLKKQVLIRKNSLFYKSTWGALVGDILLGTIMTCEYNNVNPFDYLIAAQANADKLEKDPHAWLPWNYTQNELCPHVKTHSTPIIEVHPQHSPPIVELTMHNFEDQKKPLRDRIKGFFKQLRPSKMMEK